MTITTPRSARFAFNQIAKSLCAFSVTALLAVTATAQIASGTTGISHPTTRQAPSRIRAGPPFQPSCQRR